VFYPTKASNMKKFMQRKVYIRVYAKVAQYSIVRNFTRKEIDSQVPKTGRKK